MTTHRNPDLKSVDIDKCVWSRIICMRNTQFPTVADVITNLMRERVYNSMHNLLPEDDEGNAIILKVEA